MQGNAIATPDATDTSIAGEPIQPEYGRGATFTNPGLKLYDNRTLSQMFSTIFFSADRYREPFEAEWLRAFSQYHGAVDAAGKEAWQSLVHAPYAKRDVDTIAARIVAIMFSEADWFDIEPEARYQDILVEIAKKAVYFQFNRGRFREPLETSLKDALICGNGPLKVIYEQRMQPTMEPQYLKNPPRGMFGKLLPTGGKFEMRRAMKQVSSLRFEPIIPTDFWLDPSGQNRFVIHRVKRHISDLWKLAKPQYDPVSMREVAPAIYDPAEVAKVMPGARSRKLDNFAATIRRESLNGYDDMTVDLYEFWGDFYDPTNGVTIFPNCLATFADTQWVMRRPEQNPLWHQMSPFVNIRATLLPHQIYGYGFLMQASPLQSEMDRMLQLFSDKAHLSVPMMEADTTAAKNPEDFQGGHIKAVPGKVFNKKGGADRKIFTPVDMGVDISEWEIQYYRLLQEALTLTNGVNEFVTGQQTSSNRKTKAEVEVRVSASQQNFNDVGQYVEEHSLSPLVKMVYELTLQFENNLASPRFLKMFSDDPQAQKIIQELAAMPPAERWAHMNLDAAFRVTGVTLQVTRQQRLDRLMNFLRVLAGDQAMAMIVDKRELLRQLLINFSLTHKLIIPIGDAVLQAFEQNMLAQVIGPMAAGGGAAPNPNNEAVAAQASAAQGAQQEQDQGGPAPPPTQ